MIVLGNIQVNKHNVTETTTEKRYIREHKPYECNSIPIADSTGKQSVHGNNKINIHNMKN